MELLKSNITNPFNAPIYHEERVSSTMDISRELAYSDEPHGTVIVADYQSAGRGRIKDRVWKMESGANLPFTILLRYPQMEDIPQALTLRTGLAVCLAIEEFAPALKDKVQVKWPNDIMIHSKKVSGILCEASGNEVHIGIGINVAQNNFSPELQKKATSIALATGTEIKPKDRYNLLEKTLTHFYNELYNDTDWKPRLENRLYKKAQQVIFIEGPPGSNKQVNGTLTGISETGEILIDKKAYITGELKL